MLYSPSPVPICDSFQETRHMSRVNTSQESHLNVNLEMPSGTCELTIKMLNYESS